MRGLVMSCNQCVRLSLHHEHYSAVRASQHDVLLCHYLSTNSQVCLCNRSVGVSVVSTDVPPKSLSLAFTTMYFLHYKTTS